VSAIKIAELFGAIGFKVDFTNLNRFQQRLSQAKAQLLSIQAASQKSLAMNANVGAIRSLNSELAKTLTLTRQIAAQGPIRVRNSGPAGSAATAGNMRNRNSGSGGGGATAGLLGGLGFGRGSPIARNFLGGFTAALAVRSLFQAQVALDGIKVGLEATLRPGQTLGETMGFLRGESERLGFEFASSAFEFSKLAAAGNAAGLSINDTREIFIAAQEASRVFSLSVADTEGVLKAFTQIISKGKVTAEELRNQLGDRLPAAVPLAAKALGVTTQELGVMLEKGQVLANDFLPKFAKTLRESFGGSVEEASKTAQAQLNRFLNAWFDFRNEINRSGVGEIMALAIEGATNLLKVLTPLVKALAQGLRAITTAFHAAFRIMHTFFKTMPKAIIWIGLLTAAVALLAKTQLAAILPWVLGAAAIGALLILIDDLATALRGGDSVIKDMSESTNQWVNALADALLFFGGLVKLLAEFAAALAMGNSFDLLADSCRAFQALLLQVLESLAKIADTVTFGLPSWLGEKIGSGAFRTQEFFQTTLPGKASDAIQAGRRQMQMVFGGNQITVSGGGNAQEIATVVEQKLNEHSDSQMRQARAQFGDAE
jgi:tape measure domain-containing protein